MSTPKYLAIDLETTGLDPSTCAILEVAAVVLDEDLVELERLVTAVECDDEILDRASHEVLRMHLGTGLIERLSAGDWWVGRGGGHVEVDTVAIQLEALLDTFPERPILLGSSVHFDRGFLREHMPNVERRLHHRHVDASSFKLMAPELPWPKPKVAHVAEHDVDCSIEICRMARFGLGDNACSLMAVERDIQRLLDELAPPVEGQPRDLMAQIKRAMAEVSSWPDRPGGGKVRPTTFGDARSMIQPGDAFERGRAQGKAEEHRRCTETIQRLADEAAAEMAVQWPDASDCEGHREHRARWYSFERSADVPVVAARAESMGFAVYPYRRDLAVVSFGREMAVVRPDPEVTP